MTKTELLEMIRNLENSGVEFKRDTIEDYKLAKEIVAFSNSDGGRILLGVDDDGTITGISRSNLEQWVMTTCRDKLRPEIIPYFEIVRDVEPGKDVAVITLRRGWTVHSRWHNHHSTYYIRVGSESREASKEELERLFQQRGAFRLEVRPVSGSSIGDFDIRRLLDYFQRVRRQDSPPVDNMPGWQQLLVNTEIMTDEEGGISCTVAGLLLFGKNPNRYIPQAGIDAVAYPGTEKDYAAYKRLSIRGPIVGLFTAENQLIESGIVEQAVQFIKEHAGISEGIEEGIRVESPTYPEEVVREAVVNAVVHRDYLLSASNIELSVYTDRIEIISPGRLPNGITPERMRVGCRAARNQLLKDILRDYGYMEHMGMGVPRKIIKGMRNHNGTEPDLVEDGERFILRLWKGATS
ncbi:MAG TPA: ATP-binding protein [Syntrophales bacterium]|nr:ATP-binding protein [Syntrophales bacterium]